MKTTLLSTKITPRVCAAVLAGLSFHSGHSAILTDQDEATYANSIIYAHTFQNSLNDGFFTGTQDQCVTLVAVTSPTVGGPDPHSPQVSGEGEGMTLADGYFGTLPTGATNNARCFPMLNTNKVPNSGAFSAPAYYRNFGLSFAFEPNSAPCVSGIYFEGGHVNNSGLFVTPSIAKFNLAIRTGGELGPIIWESPELPVSSPWNKWFVEMPTTIDTKTWAGQTIYFEFRFWGAATGSIWSNQGMHFQRFDDVALVGSTSCSVPPVPLNIGDLVWEDLNNDGCKDAAESGINGVTMKLYLDDGDGVFEPSTGDALQATQITSGGGLYNFSDLNAGDYFVQVCPDDFDTGGVLASYIPTGGTPVGGDSDQNDKNHSINTGIRTLVGVASSKITLSTDSEPDTGVDGDDKDGNKTIDFGFKTFTPVSVGNLVWADDNENGVYDSGTESPIPGVKVDLYIDNGDGSYNPTTDTLIQSTVTSDPAGTYCFDGLVPDNYIVVLAGSNWSPGQPLFGALPTINAGDPDAVATDNDNNGFREGIPIVSAPVTLSSGGEPTNDGDGNNSNKTVDFGVIPGTVPGCAQFYASRYGGKFMELTPTGNRELYSSPRGSGIFLTRRQPSGEIGGIEKYTDGTFNYFNIVIVDPVTLSSNSFQIKTDDGTTNVFGFRLDESGGKNVAYYNTDSSPGTVYCIDLSTGNIEDTFTLPNANPNMRDFMIKNGLLLYPTSVDNDADTSTFVYSAFDLASESSKGLIDKELPLGTLYTQDGFIFLSVTNNCDGGTSSGGTTGVDDKSGDTTGVDDRSGGTTGAGELAGVDDKSGGTTGGSTGGTRTDATATYYMLDCESFKCLRTYNLSFNASNFDFAIPSSLDGYSGWGGTLRPVFSADGGEVDYANPESYIVSYTYDVDSKGGSVILYSNDLINFTTFAAYPDGTSLKGLDLPCEYTAFEFIPACGDSKDTPSPDQDPGFDGLMSIGDLVWKDTNNDGINNNSEEPIPGVLVDLFVDDGDGVFNSTKDMGVGSATTGPEGIYRFKKLPEGACYWVRVSPQNFRGGGALEGMINSTNHTVANDDLNDRDHGRDSMAPSMFGILSTCIELKETTEPTNDGDADNNSNLSIDFGFYSAPSNMKLGNLVWMDLNNNGLCDAGENGIGGVTVDLYKDSNGNELFEPGAGDAKVGTTTTSGTGIYSFTGLAPGKYYVDIPASNWSGALAGYESSTGFGGADFDVDCDDSGMEERHYDEQNQGVASSVVTLDSNLEPPTTGDPSNPLIFDGDDKNGNQTVDFGFNKPLNLGNLVWFDTNKDSDKDSGESGVGANVQLDLFIDDGDEVFDPKKDVYVSSTFTNASGNYNFTRLGAGGHFVRVSPLNFVQGAVLEGYYGSQGEVPNNNDVDEVDNGVNTVALQTDGIVSSLVELAPNSEPDTGADTDGKDGNLTVDFGVYSVAPAEQVGIGNLVFKDANRNGVADTGEGVDGVTVELWTPGNDGIVGNTDDSGVDDPNQAGKQFYSVPTSGGGCYEFSGLASGKYYVKVIRDNFGPGNPLDGWFSIAGTSSGDNNLGEDGIDNATPVFNGINSGIVVLSVDGQPTDDGGGETGKDKTGDNSDDNNIDYTVDFGFDEGKPSSFADWQIAYSLGGADGPADNPDGDLFSNVIEFAFCLNPELGTGSAFCLEPNITSGYDIVFHRALGKPTGTEYCVAYISNLSLSTSTGGWTETSLDSLPAGVTVTVTPSADGQSETVKLENVEALGANDATEGYFMMVVKLDCDNDSTADVIDYTDVQGFKRTVFEANECETCAFPFLSKPVFSGKVEGVSGNNLTFGTTFNKGLDFTPGSSGSIMLTGSSYYVEVLSGSEKGHRFDISGGSAESITLASDSNLASGAPYSTKLTNAGLPAGLNGAEIMVIEHTTLGELAPTAAFKAGDDATTGDNVLIPVRNSDPEGADTWNRYYLLDMPEGTADRWVISGVTDRKNDIIAPDQGLFLHAKTGIVTLETYGMVRENSFAVPLYKGYNLVAPGYPLALSPTDLGLVSPIVSGSGDQSKSDQILTWDRDGVSDEDKDGYVARWFVDNGKTGAAQIQRWAKVGDLSLKDEAASKFLTADRSYFLRIGANQLDYKVAQPWTNKLPFNNGKCD